MSVLDDALRYGGFALAHAAWIASDLEPGELICPVAVVTRGDERKVVPFEASTQAEAIERGKASFSEFRDEADAWAFVREGLFSVVGEDAPKRDVLSVSSWVKQLDEPIVIQQLFRPKSQGGFCLIDDLMISIHGSMPSYDVHTRLCTIAMEGIAQHPHGERWSQWACLSR
jgi:hypothetical protein